MGFPLWWGEVGESGDTAKLPAQPDDNAVHPAYAGNFRHAMDSKHRVTIPSRWRQGDADPFFILPSQDNLYLSVLPPSEFKKVNDTVNNDPKISPADRRWFARFYFSQAQHCVLDKQGRLLLPDEFCQLAALTGDTVLVGTFDRFEIWSPERWELAKLRGVSTYQQVANLIGI